MDYNSFIEIAIHLSPSDIISACLAVNLWGEYCRNTSFYSDLIYRAYGLRKSGANINDYAHLYFLDHLKPAQNGIPIDVKISNLVVDDLRQKEIQAWLIGQRLKFYQINQQGELITAYSFEGALLKMFYIKSDFSPRLEFINDDIDFIGYKIEEDNITNDEDIKDIAVGYIINKYSLFAHLSKTSYHKDVYLIQVADPRYI